MLRMLTATSILALATVPAVAQNGQTPEPTMEAPVDMATPEADAPVPVEAPAPESAPQTREQRAAALVESEFATYDADQNGELSQAEFSSWVMTLAKSDKPAANPAQEKAAKEKWAANAFIAADVDKSKKVSKAEMSTFLQG